MEPKETGRERLGERQTEKSLDRKIIQKHRHVTNKKKIMNNNNDTPKHTQLILRSKKDKVQI